MKLEIPDIFIGGRIQKIEMEDHHVVLMAKLTHSLV